MRAASAAVPLAAIALLGLAPVSTAGENGAAPLTGRVIGVSDGDTITVVVDRDPIKVRLAEIDAPERGEPWANRAKRALSAKVFGEVVELRVVDTDRYGRTVAKVYRDGRDVCREMVREGNAWVYRAYSRDPSLLEDEQRAREAKAGLWSLAEAQQIPPWAWRHGEKTRQLPPPGARSTPGSEPSCGAKRYCREMSSCTEARFYLERCGLKRLDGDGDGVPCESLCP